MVKCFLSHSSKDKDSYVRIVADKIPKEAVIMDDCTFEEGMGNMEEIVTALDETSLFVIFLSEASLETKWVQFELNRAKDLLDQSQIERVYPIIIDSSIDYEDKRIPEWLRESLNIKPILKPSIAASKIRSRLIEISWKYHPKLKERQSLFVGRNDLIKEVEERLDDFSKITPTVLIASGLPSIGRKAFLKHVAKKGNIVRSSFGFPIVSLSAQDGIEDFILKIYDLGFTNVSDLRKRISGDMSEKINLSKEIILQVINEKQRLIIEDRGAIVQKSLEIADWFNDVVESVKTKDFIALWIVSKYRPNRMVNRQSDAYYVLSVPELTKNERNGLLSRCVGLQGLSLTGTDFSFFSDLLTGFPEQVFYTTDLIESEGLSNAKRQAHLIQQFGSDKASLIVNSFQKEPIKIDFIYFLSRFEFISYDVLFDIVSKELYAEVLMELLGLGICEKIGTVGEYVRVNDVVRDYIIRGRFGLPEQFKKPLEDHVANFIEKYEDDNVDVSDYIFSAKEALLSGIPIPDDLLIPSIFIKAIKKLYEGRDYKQVLVLSNRVLTREPYLHKSTVDHIRSFTCRSLARLKDSSRFFDEVKLVDEPDRSFYKGFYFRITGQLAKAEESLKRVLKGNEGDQRAVGELIQVYMQIDEPELALGMAKKSYHKQPGNVINANNYFNCLIENKKNDENKKELDLIIKTMDADQSERGGEFRLSMKAKLLAHYDNNEEKSMKLIDEAIESYPDVDYPYMTKADLAIHFKNKEKLTETVLCLEKKIKKNSPLYKKFILNKAILLSMNGQIQLGKALLNKELQGVGPEYLERKEVMLERFSAL